MDHLITCDFRDSFYFMPNCPNVFEYGFLSMMARTKTPDNGDNFKDIHTSFACGSFFIYSFNEQTSIKALLCMYSLEMQNVPTGNGPVNLAS